MGNFLLRFCFLDMTRVRSQLSDEDKKDTCIAFAFSVLSAYFAGDYQQFFSLYKNAPMMAGYVMDVHSTLPPEDAHQDLHSVSFEKANSEPSVEKTIDVLDSIFFPQNNSVSFAGIGRIFP